MRIKNLRGGQWGPILKNSTSSPWKCRKTTSSAVFCATGAWVLRNEFFSRARNWFSKILIIIKDQFYGLWSLQRTTASIKVKIPPTWVSVRHNKVATSNLFGLDKYLFILNCLSNSNSCCDVKAVRGRLVFPAPVGTKPKNRKHYILKISFQPKKNWKSWDY